MEKMIFFNKSEKLRLLHLFFVNIFAWVLFIWTSKFDTVTKIGGLPIPELAYYILGIWVSCGSIFLSCLSVNFVIVNEKDIVLKTVFKKLKFIEWKNVISIEEVVVDERRKKTYYFIFDGTEEEINKKNGYQSKKTPIKILKTSKSMIWFEHYLDNQKKNSINDN